MFSNRFYTLFTLVAALLLTGCSSTSPLKKETPERVSMQVSEDPELYSNLSNDHRGASRGIGLPFAGNAVSMAKDAILNLIDKEEARLTHTYRKAQSDLYFYNSTSSNHYLDPTGMQFEGVALTRTGSGDDGQADTTFHAKFSVDTSNPIEILNNSIFRLKLDELQVRGTNLPGTRRWFMPWTWFDKPMETVNLDVNIRIFASWVDENMNMKRNEPMGEFFLVLRDVPLEGADNYEQYIASAEGKQLSGYSYMVPRSVSFQTVGNRVQQIYGHGLYSMEVDIVESRKRGEIATTAAEVIERSNVLEE